MCPSDKWIFINYDIYDSIQSPVIHLERDLDVVLVRGLADQEVISDHIVSLLSVLGFPVHSVAGNATVSFRRKSSW